MTREYAELSLKVGFVAAAVDNALNSVAFEVATRVNSWNFSEEFYSDMVALAVQKGCPRQVIRVAEEMAARQVQDEDFMAELMKEQERRDAEYAKRFGKDGAGTDTGADSNRDPARGTIGLAMPEGGSTQDDRDRHEDVPRAVKVRCKAHGI